LSPDAGAHPEQAALFSAITAHLAPLGVVSGWAEPEEDLVAIAAKNTAVVACGAPNLSFLSALNVGVNKLPYHRTPKTTTLNTSQVYITFQSNEGDTPKNAYSFREGNWLSPARGTVPIGWGVSPLLGRLFPGLFEYYVTTAKATDQFFAATGGIGYTYPWALPDPNAFFRAAEPIFKEFMPSPGNWVDVWEGACPESSGDDHHLLSHLTLSQPLPQPHPHPQDQDQDQKETSANNPCMSMYERYRHQSKHTVDGFSQQPTLTVRCAFFARNLHPRMFQGMFA
jgi:hypothetical protein